MNRFSVALIIIGGLVIYLADHGTSNFPKEINNDREVEVNESYPAKAAEWEFSRKVNPLTGEIPSFALYKTWQALVEDGRLVPHQNTERGTTEEWQSVDDFFESIGITRIVVDPNDPQQMYFCTGEGWFNADAARGAGVWKSTDGGASWTQLDSTMNNSFIYCLDMNIHPVTSDIYVGTRGVSFGSPAGGLFRSQDGGINWKKVLETSNYYITDIEFTQNGGIFVGSYQDGLYYSDSGHLGNWTRMNTGLPPPSTIRRIELATAPTNDSVAYLIPATSSGAIFGFYKTTDKGNNWTQITDPGEDLKFARSQAWYDMIIKVDPNNENVVAAGGLHIWRTTDGGIWRTNNFTDPDPDIHDKNLSYNVTQFYSCAIHPDSANPTILGGTQDNGSLMATDSFISNFQRVSGADGSYCMINHQNGSIMYTSTQYRRFFRLLDGGFGVRDTLTNPYLENEHTQFINSFEMDPNDPDLIYMASNRGLWRLADATTAVDSDWAQATRINIGTITAIGITTNLPNTVYIGRRANSGAVFRLDRADTTGDTDVPQNLDVLNQLPIDGGPLSSLVYCSSVFVDPDNADHVLVTYSNYGITSIWETNNGLADTTIWKSIEGDLPDLPVNWAILHPDDPKVCYVATDLGVFYTNMINGDSTKWLVSNDGMANVRVEMLRVRENDLAMVAATHGRGLYTTLLDPGAVNNQVTWQERGPANVGGRTRSVMIDPNDPTGRTVWISSVSGGLWKTTNIDSIRDGLTDPILPLRIREEPVKSSGFVVYPNPFGTSGVTLKSNSFIKQFMIYSLDGRLIFSAQPESTKFIWVPGKDISAGIYIISIRTTTDLWSKKVLYLEQ
ncbi:MAG: T9SS type A sorting domain-containing protein [Bacteroidetes bacterium]|nr:T9SS type A sorting domain-containing protein [Bacteroidota bacterium]